MSRKRSRVDADALEPLRIGILRGDGCDELSVQECAKILTHWHVSVSVVAVDVSQIGSRGLPEVDVLVIPGGDDEPNSACGYKLGQRKALGRKGREVIRDALRHGKLKLYVGICAGAFLASQKRAGTPHASLCISPMQIKDEDNFGNGNVKGAVRLRVNATTRSGDKDIISAWTRMKYDDGPLMHLPKAAGAKVKVRVLATHMSRVHVFHDECDPKQSYYSVQDNIAQAPAVILNSFGKGQVLLIGPHPELSFLPSDKRRWALLDLITAVLGRSDLRSLSKPAASKKRKIGNLVTFELAPGGSENDLHPLVGCPLVIHNPALLRPPPPGRKTSDRIGFIKSVASTVKKGDSHGAEWRFSVDLGGRSGRDHAWIPVGDIDGPNVTMPLPH